VKKRWRFLKGVFEKLDILRFYLFMYVMSWGEE
jgi:hypothetical protein